MKKTVCVKRRRSQVEPQERTVERKSPKRQKSSQRGNRTTMSKAKDERISEACVIYNMKCPETENCLFNWQFNDQQCS